MLLQGLVIMVVGVGAVVGFLSLLVCVLMISAKIIPRFNHILPDETLRTRIPKTATHHAADASQKEIAVAIAAAMAQHRNG